MKDIDTDVQELVIAVGEYSATASYEPWEDPNYDELTAKLLAAGWVPPTCSRLALAALGAGDVGRATALLTPIS